MRTGIATTVTVLALSLSACSPGSPPTPGPTTTQHGEPCTLLAVGIVDAVQEYVDSFAGATAEGIPAGVTARQGDFAAVTAELRAEAEELGCDPGALAADIREELDRLSGGSPVQDAIAAAFRAGPLGTADPSDLGAVQLTVATSEELVAALAVAGSGSVIRLAAGEFRVVEPLVMLRPVTLVGAGRGRTVITSTAAEGALVLSTDGDAVLRDLTVAGGSGASVVLVAGGGYVLDRVGIEGAPGGGYGIVLRPSSGPLLASGTRRELTDVEVRGTPGGGVVVAGSETPTLRGITVEDTAGCGLCWIESGAGRAEDVTITGAQVGVRVDDDAAPLVRGAGISGSQVGIAFTGRGAPRITGAAVIGGATGIQVTGDGAGSVEDTTVADASEVGVRVSDAARVVLTGVTVTGPSPVGIALVGESRPSISGVGVRTEGEVGLIWAESAAGSATGLLVSGPRLAVQLSDDASPTFEGVTVETATAGALLANGRSAGQVAGLTCSTGDGALVALAEDTTTAVTGTTGCEILDER